MKKQYGGATYLFYLSLAALQISCSKSSETLYLTVSDQVKAYYLFQPGTYWIYQNSKSHQVDCTYISSPPEFYQEKFILDDNKTVHSVTDHYMIRFEGHIFRWCAIEPDVVSFGNSSPPDFMAYNAGIPLGDARHYYNHYYFENLNFYNEVMMGSRNFFSVSETRDTHPPEPGTSFSRAMSFLSAKNVGLIQTTIVNSNHDSTWNLIRYHIVQ
ncbi:MAG: hypothetical protein WCJ26_14645 [bacterium]